MKQNKIRILAIAPYESMKMLMIETVKKFDDIELTVFIGDLEQGLLLARHNFYSDYDVIISRGGTASMLREQLDLPIIEIEISPLDILRAMKLGENISRDYAIVGFPNISRNARIICEIMETTIDIYSINGADEVESVLKEVSGKGTRAILCDMIAYTTALRFGLNPVLIKSGDECIKSAFERARQLYYTYQNLREENRFLRNLVWKHINHTIVFDEAGGIFFSTLANNSNPIVEYLRSERNREMEGNDCRIIKQISNVRYSIRLTKEFFNQKEYTVYYFTESKVSLPDIRRGIRYLGQPEAQKEFDESIYGIIGLRESILEKIELLNQNKHPILLYGEEGTCKEQVVKYLYLKSNWKNKPLVIVDCFMLKRKAWEYLMEHHNSPLAQDGCTLYIKNIDLLSFIQRKQLLANILEMNVCRRNRVIFSSTCEGGESVSTAGKDFLETLCCLTLYIPTLRSEMNHFTLMLNKYLNYVNFGLEKNMRGAEKRAIQCLQEYEWPHNYTQFQRVLEELVMASADGMIREKDVNIVLEDERTIVTVGKQSEGTGIRINLNQSLEKINQDIICKILEEEDGNRTNVANRLEISRSTLWRFLKR